MKFTFKPECTPDRTYYLQKISDKILVKNYNDKISESAVNALGFYKFLEYKYRHYNSSIYQSLFIESPFGNCQAGGIGYLNCFIMLLKFIESSEPAVFNHFKDDKTFRWYVSSVALRRVSLFGVGGIFKPLLMADVNFGHMPDVHKWFDVYTETPYTSTNGSSMVSLILNIAQKYSDIRYNNAYSYDLPNLDAPIPLKEDVVEEVKPKPVYKHTHPKASAPEPKEPSNNPILNINSNVAIDPF